VTKMDGEKEGQSRQVFAVNTTTQRAYSVNAHPLAQLTVETTFFHDFFISFPFSRSLHFMSMCVTWAGLSAWKREGNFSLLLSLPLPSWLRLDVRSLGRYLSLLVIVIVLASAPSTFCWREVSLNILGENQLK
jgi:hypothetical protein